MISIVLMGIASILSIYFVIQIIKTENLAVAEILLSRGWHNRFQRQEIEEKKEEYIRKYQKYHSYSEKKVRKKLKEWDKQIEGYQKAENGYLAGRKLSVLDMVSLFGYQLFDDLSIDANNDLLRGLSKECEHTGYIEIERNQYTNGKANAQIYAKFLLATLFSYLVLAVIFVCAFVGIGLAAKLDSTRILILSVVGFVVPVLFGYLPYDALRNKAKVRQEEIDRDFPNLISKIALLITAGMNVTNAMEEAAESGEGLIYQELRIALKELNQASTMQEALIRLQCRCDNRFLDKMVAVISKSYSSGNANLAQDLRNINADCWLDKKHSARRMGEAIQTKLFVPTMLMFVGILVVIIIPAMSGFNF